MAETPEAKSRLTADDVVISPVEEKDLISIVSCLTHFNGETYCLTMIYRLEAIMQHLGRIGRPDKTIQLITVSTSNRHNQMEPAPPILNVRVEKFAKRMKPWLTSPYGRWRKASLVGQPEVAIGHAGWLIPSSTHVPNHWRHDAAEKLGWAVKEGWTPEEQAQLWSHVDLEAWQGSFLGTDHVREELMRDTPHW